MVKLSRTAWGLFASLLLWNCQATPQDPINVILISIDSLRADHLRSYGYRRKTSPTLDRLAGEGARFGTAIAESSWTLPTHVSMLTGLAANVHGVQHDSMQLDPLRSTLAELLGEQGYRTGGIYSGPYLHPIFGFSQGFEEYEGVIGETAFDEENFEPDFSKLETRAKVVRAHRKSHRSITSPSVTDKAIDFLSKSLDRRFFLFLHYFDVHYDYVPPESFWRKFDRDYEGSLSGKNFARKPAIHDKMNPRDFRHLVALYDGEILFTDHHIGRLVDALDRNGWGDSTLIVVTSDHGEEFFEHGAKGHRHTLFDELLKVPLIMRLPGRIAPGLNILEQVRHIDIMPTILSLANVPVPEEVGGVDLSGLLEGKSRAPSLLAVSRLVRPFQQDFWSSLRTPEFKYILHREGTRETELLYDLKQDPEERRPLERSENKHEYDRLRAMLERQNRKELRLRESLANAPDNEIQLPPELEEQLRALGYVQ